MPTIQVLPFEVANLIAAGEVVDRPASAIKEMMENAIDAGASHITVEIQNGGVTLMRVTDDGCGMSAEDLPMAIRRHATSKIREAKDLDGIFTLGFRGEALAAISSVSDMRIISKRREDDMGAMLEIRGGTLLGVTERGCRDGTTVIVENLFANVPARRKFLKRDATEAMAVTGNVERVALSHPEIAIRYISDGVTKLETAGDGQLKSAVWAVFGKDFAARLLPLESEHEGIRITGFVGRSDNVRANRGGQNFFINQRYVRSRTAQAALEQAFVSYIPPEKYPCCVLNITLNPARVDVNVHPAKLEVKFSNEKPVFEAVYYAVRQALEANTTRPAFEISQKKPINPTGGRVSDMTTPIETERPASLGRRQVTIDTPAPVVTATPPTASPVDRPTAASASTAASEMPTKPSAKPVVEPVASASATPVVPPVAPSAGESAERGATVHPPQERITAEDYIQYYVNRKGKKKPAATPAATAVPPAQYAQKSVDVPDTTVSGTVAPPRKTEDAPYTGVATLPQNRQNDRHNDEDFSAMLPCEPPMEVLEAEARRLFGDMPPAEFDVLPTDADSLDRERLATPTPSADDMSSNMPLSISATDEALLPPASVADSDVGASTYRIVGEVFNSYVIVEVHDPAETDRMLIIDKHAAHERIIFEDLKAKMKDKTVESQLLMIPIDVMLMSDEVGLLDEYRPELEAVGFTYTCLRNTVRVDSLPSGIDPAAVPDMIATIAAGLRAGVDSARLTRDIFFEKALYQASCKAAIKAGRSYPPEHIRWLVDKLMALPDITFCPHGRPVAMEMKKRTIDHQFERC